MPLDIFKRVFPEEKLHHKFKELEKLSSEKKILQEWLVGFEDRDNKIVKEFQTTFHSSLWEFYLHKVFRDCHMSVDYNYDSPDFIITKPFPFIVEATVANIKNGQNENDKNWLKLIHEPFIHLRDDFEEIITEATVRNSNAILSKLKKYNNTYLKKEHISPTTPYVIALCSHGHVDHSYEYLFAILKLLYGHSFDISTFITVRESQIIKPNTDSAIPVNLFATEEFKPISAILFSCSVTLQKLKSLALSHGLPSPDVVHLIRHDMEWPNFKVQPVSVEYPEELVDGLYLLLNPNATNPLPEDLFSETEILHHNGEAFNSNNCPLFARYSAPGMQQPVLGEALIKGMNRANAGTLQNILYGENTSNYLPEDINDLESLIKVVGTLAKPFLTD